jgi:ribosomal protein L3
VIGLDFRPDHHELIGLRIGQRSQERRIIDRKDGGVGTDANGQREQNSESQAGVSGQHTEAEPDVLKKILHTCLPW